MNETEPKVVCFKSESRGIGRTTTMSNVAYFLAHVGYRVGVIDQEPEQPSKLRRLVASDIHGIGDEFPIGQHRGSLRFLSVLPSNKTAMHAILTEGMVTSGDCGLIIFCHRLDRDGLTQANKALETYEPSTLVLVPSLIPVLNADPEIYRYVITTIADLRKKHNLVTPVMLWYALLVREELHCRVFQTTDHPLVKNYIDLAKEIIFNPNINLPFPLK